MKRYLKLVNFEFNRFFKLYLVLLGLTTLLQMIGVIFESRKYVNLVNEEVYGGMMTKNEFLNTYWSMSFVNVSYSPMFIAPIALCVITLGIYVFFIWYRDWLGKNTFSYRLLILPTARINVYLAKATTILLLILGLVTLQLALIPVERQVFEWIIPSEFRTDLSIFEIINSTEIMVFLIPESLFEFILHYGFGMIAVILVFTAILFERSFRIKGVFYGILYSAVSLFLLFSPTMMNVFLLGNYFYPMELFLMELAAGTLVGAVAIYTSNYLIKHKIMA
ncbi:hypothetical protein WAK64_07965 [Bacillus spongiae]|uniref:ABC transporter permease subunit n=1 Tax=Bacillus spongiae TaxID=2683610 RepID=A0ABU8HCN9_9BACI